VTFEALHSCALVDLPLHEIDYRFFDLYNLGRDERQWRQKPRA
jgi:hypothetical protein